MMLGILGRGNFTELEEGLEWP